MSRQSELAQLGRVFDNSALSNRNLIINGAMQVWQRGTSHTASGGYSADRWWMANATSVARSTEAPEGFTYSAFITASGGGNDIIGQPIELTTGSSSPMVVGQKVTVSLYAKTVSGTDDIAAKINFRDAKYSGTNQSAFGNGDTWTVTTTWQRFTTTLTVPSINPTNVLAGLEIFGIGSSMYITGIQLEVGDTATPFEHRSYGQELALCQRYFCIPVNNLDEDGNTNVMSSIGVGRGAAGGAVVVYALHSPVPMRDRPAITSSGPYYITDGTSRTQSTPSTVTISQFSPNSTIMLANYAFSSAVCDDDRVNMVGAATAVKITLDAEL